MEYSRLLNAPLKKMDSLNESLLAYKKLLC